MATTRLMALRPRRTGWLQEERGQVPCPVYGATCGKRATWVGDSAGAIAFQSIREQTAERALCVTRGAQKEPGIALITEDGRGFVFSAAGLLGGWWAIGGSGVVKTASTSTGGGGEGRRVVSRWWVGGAR